MADRAGPRSEHYDFEELAPGVTFAHARRNGTALCNSAVVDLGGSTLVFDTSVTLQSARDLQEASVSLTSRRATFAANSHWHLDHIVGNQIFSDRPIYASRRTAAILLEKLAELQSELAPDRLQKDIEELERQARSATSVEGRAIYAAVLNMNRVLQRESTQIRLTAPSDSFDGDLRLPGDTEAHLMTFGAGHTESDTVLFLPKSRVLFAGDLVVANNHPNLTSGDPEHWLTVIEHLFRLKPERIGTGHGPAGSPETLAEMKDYLTTILELARDEIKPDVPARFRNWGEPDQFYSNLEYARGRLRSNTR